MSSVDSRIVTMKFDNATFEQNAKTSLNTLDRIKQSMNFSNVTNTTTKGLGVLSGALGQFTNKNPFNTSTQGLNELQSQANHFSMSTITGGVTGVSKSFVAMSTVAITALAGISMAAFRTGAQMTKSLTISPVLDGLREYETNLNSIQTIMANTGLDGKKGLDLVNSALDELNHYSDKTIYNFSEMARNIGTFTAAGVDLDTSTAAIKGIANLAAVSGSNANQASSAMYQLSQALAAGKLTLIDWNSVVNAGMGGKVFQESLKETARVNGVAIDDILKQHGSFRESLQEGWITSDILTQTLAKFTGDLNKSQLKSMGYNEQQIKGIIKMGQTATDAATKVKTATQLVDTLKETVGSGWAKTWSLVIGDFDEAKSLWTGVNDALGGMLNRSSQARNKMLSEWKDLGGRTALIKGIKNAWDALLSVLDPIRDAFRDIFPAKTAQDLYNMTTAFRDFTKGLIISDDTAENLRRTFRGVFAVFDIVGQVVKGLFGLFGRLVGAVAEGSGGFLEFTGGIGDFLVSVDEALKKGDDIGQFFTKLGDIIAVPLQAIKIVGGAILGFFGDVAGGAGSSALGRAEDRFSGLISIADRIADAFGALSPIIAKIRDFIQPALESIGDQFANLGTAIANGLSSGDYSGILDVLNTGIFAVIGFAIHRFLKNGLQLNASADLGGGMFASIKESFDTLTGTMQTMQQQIRAKTLMTIATAIGILTLSVIALSMIDSKKLTKALTAISVSFAQLLGAMMILEKIPTTKGFLNITGITGAMILMATAVLILSAAVKNLSDLNWEELAKGLIGVTVLLGGLSAAAKIMSGVSGGLVRAGLAMIPLSIGILILSEAVKSFAEMSWGEMLKGMVGLAGALAAVALAVMAIPASIIVIGPGMVAFAGAMVILAQALQSFGGMDWGEIGKGLVAMAGALTLVAAAVYAIPVSIVLIGPALITVAIALGIMAKALQSFGGMSWSEIGRGLVAMGGSLAILAVGLMAMSGTISGSAALLVAATALAILTPVLVTLGSLSWESIIKGLVTLAGVFVVLGLAGLALAPVVPALMGLGIALALIGAGVALAGAGVLALSIGITALAAAGAAGMGVLMAGIGAVIGMIPDLAQAMGEGMIQFAAAVSQGGPALVKALSTIIGSMLTALTQNIPKFGKMMTVLIVTTLGVLRRAIPLYVRTGIEIILGILRGIRDNIGKIVEVAGDIVVKFLTAVGNQFPKIADAGAKLIIKFINAIAAAVKNNSEALRHAGVNLALAIVDGMTGGLLSWGIDRVRSAASALADAIPGPIKDVLGINSPSKVAYDLMKSVGEGAVNALNDSADDVKVPAEGVGKSAAKTLQASLRKHSKNISISDMDLSPKITPVLDLTKIAQESSKIGGMLGKHSINADVSYRQALALSDTMEAAKSVKTDTDERPIVKEYNYTQNNYSPKHISPSEQYRNSRSLLALKKEDL